MKFHLKALAILIVLTTILLVFLTSCKHSNYSITAYTKSETTSYDVNSFDYRDSILTLYYMEPISSNWSKIKLKNVYKIKVQQY